MGPQEYIKKNKTLLTWLNSDLETHWQLPIPWAFAHLPVSASTRIEYSTRNYRNVCRVCMDWRKCHGDKRGLVRWRKEIGRGKPWASPGRGSLVISPKGIENVGVSYETNLFQYGQKRRSLHQWRIKPKDSFDFSRAISRQHYIWTMQKGGPPWWMISGIDGRLRITLEWSIFDVDLSETKGVDLVPCLLEYQFWNLLTNVD